MAAQYHKRKYQVLIPEEAILEKMTNTKQHRQLRQQKKNATISDLQRSIIILRNTS
ncbi:709_t:CDS:1, partial [Racocetra fulgida]